MFQPHYYVVLLLLSINISHLYVTNQKITNFLSKFAPKYNPYRDCLLKTFMKELPILTFEPQFKKSHPGRTAHRRIQGCAVPGDKIGESWEISGLPGHESVVSDGPFKGRKLLTLLDTHAEALLGKKLYERFGHSFPLLVKFIDSADDLSIQVHPDDSLAKEKYNGCGKTEMWVNIAPSVGAYLYCGLNRKLSPDEYRKAVDNNTIIDYLCKYYPDKDDVFFLPAGHIHSLGRGNFVLEIQQTSDTTYRIYDYNRLDADGNPRQLHIEESPAAINFSDVADTAPTRIPEGKNNEFVIADCKHFTATAIDIENEHILNLNNRDSFTIVIAIDGEVELIAPDGTTTRLTRGHTALIPASMPTVIAKGNCRLITTFINC